MTVSVFEFFVNVLYFKCVVNHEQALGEELLVVGHVMKWSREKDFLKVISCLIL